MSHAIIPASSKASKLATIKPKSELRVDRAKLRAGLPAEVRDGFRMPLEFERKITRVVRKMTAELVMKGVAAPTLEDLLNPAHNILIGVRFFDKKKRAWVDERVPGLPVLLKRMEDVYAEYYGKGITRTFLPLLNEAATPAKQPLMEAVQNCHLGVKGGNAPSLKPLEFVFCGGDDQESPAN